jgi:hypothetical protein
LSNYAVFHDEGDMVNKSAPHGRWLDHFEKIQERRNIFIVRFSFKTIDIINYAHAVIQILHHPQYYIFIR